MKIRPIFLITSMYGEKTCRINVPVKQDVIIIYAYTYYTHKYIHYKIKFNNFPSIHPQFKSLSQERAFTAKPQQTLFPSDNTIDVSKTALQRTIQQLFAFRYLHDFVLCLSAIHL